MPRIPVRVEPYNSPTRQHRHFKSKRDLVLRSLGKSAFINGSQFAILWVTARGETECYASDAFQPKLSTWFHDGVCADAVHTARQEHARVASQTGAAKRDLATLVDASGKSEGVDEDPPSTDEGSPVEQPCPTQTPAMRHSLTKLDGNAADVFGQPTPLTDSLARAATSEDPSSLAASPALGRIARKRTPVAPYIVQPSGNESVFESEAEVRAYLSAKVAEVQQNVCKILCKVWIKAIEPKKSQTHPYAGGEATRPSWWPEYVRHKEPDQLLKPDRIELLVGMLLSPYSGLTRLEMASGEMSAFIPSHKNAILRDIYNVARGYENMRRVQGDDGEFVQFTVSAAIAPPMQQDDLPASPPKNSRKRPKPRRAFSDAPYAAAALNAGHSEPQPQHSISLTIPPHGPINSSNCGPLSAPLAPSSPWYVSAPQHVPEGYYPAPPPSLPSMSLAPAWSSSNGVSESGPRLAPLSTSMPTPPCTSPEPSHLLIAPPRLHLPTFHLHPHHQQHQHPHQTWSPSGEHLPEALWPPEHEEEVLMRPTSSHSTSAGGGEPHQASYFPPQPAGPTSLPPVSLPAPAIAAFNRFERASMVAMPQPVRVEEARMQGDEEIDEDEMDMPMSPDPSTTEASHRLHAVLV